jgi:hypothetical protein
MGFFSWFTQDTDKSIAARYSSRSTFKVHMIDNKGNVWTENNYDGYGEFGGKDYYELLAEMNGITSELTGDERKEEIRLKGIDLAFKNNPMGDGTPEVLYPNLVENADGWEYVSTGPDSCPDQGFFYGDDENDEDDWNDMDN